MIAFMKADLTGRLAPQGYTFPSAMEPARKRQRRAASPKVSSPGPSSSEETR